jgi:hypothetical protein
MGYAHTRVFLLTPCEYKKHIVIGTIASYDVPLLISDLRCR